MGPFYWHNLSGHNVSKGISNNIPQFYADGIHLLHPNFNVAVANISQK